MSISDDEAAGYRKGYDDYKSSIEFPAYNYSKYVEGYQRGWKQALEDYEEFLTRKNSSEKRFL